MIAHVHDVAAVADMMRLAAGTVGRALNRRKEHEGSVWEHPYQCTMIEDGRHLFNCLRYVDLNLVRAGVVAHPSEWRWCGYDELSGVRKRYRILDLDGLVERLGLASICQLHNLHVQRISESIERRALAREAHWTESLAVGSADYIAAAQETLKGQRWTFQLQHLGGADEDADICTLRETQTPYNAIQGPKIGL